MRFMPAAIAPDVTSTISRPSSFRPTISRTISSMRARVDAPFSRVMVLVPTATGVTVKPSSVTEPTEHTERLELDTRNRLLLAPTGLKITFTIPAVPPTVRDMEASACDDPSWKEMLLTWT